MPAINPKSPIPLVEERFTHMAEIREELKASLQVAADIMKHTKGDSGSEGIRYKAGDKVWLDGKNIKTTRPKAKLAAKFLGPFEVVSVIGPVSYRLKLPATWHIHPVFHASLLAPFKETVAHGPNFLTPAPDLVNGEEEYKVEAILDACLTRNKRGVEYLVKWKGYTNFHNVLVSQDNCANAKEEINDFYKSFCNKPKNVNQVQLEIPLTMELRSLLRPLPTPYTEAIDDSQPSELQLNRLAYKSHRGRCDPKRG